MAQYIESVEKLTQWEDKQEDGSQEVVKTVSRMVQSFEHTVINDMCNEIEENNHIWGSYDFKNFFDLDDDDDDDGNSSSIDSNEQGTPMKQTISSLANAFRRSDAVYHHFASIVASEITKGYLLSGHRNVQVSLFIFVWLIFLSNMVMCVNNLFYYLL